MRQSSLITATCAVAVAAAATALAGTAATTSAQKAPSELEAQRLGPEATRPSKRKPTCLGKRATIVGTRRGDPINGSSRNDVIVGLGGNDRIDGGGGKDLICGNQGVDRLEGGAGSDRMDGGTGTDRCTGGEVMRACEETRNALPREDMLRRLAAGAYLTESFRPRFSFSIGPGWLGHEASRGVGLLKRMDPAGVFLIFDGGSTESVSAAVARLRAIAGTASSSPVPVVIGGAPGQRFDLSVTASETVSVRTGSFTHEFEPTDRVRIAAIDVRGTTVVVVIEAPVEEFEAFLAEAETVVAGVKFE
jgi:Ca2+-binding RTX toxin-like protein